MRAWLAPAHLALTLLILAWDVVLAGRIAQNRKAPGRFRTLSALCGFLVLPGIVIWLSTATAITGRALTGVDFLWPLAAILFTVQALYALTRRLVTPLLGVPIALYDIVVAVSTTLRYLAVQGIPTPEWALVGMAAQSDALAVLTGGAALASPLFVNVPMISPAYPALRPAIATVRAILAGLAAAWVAFVAVAIPRGEVALRSYQRYESARLQERPGEDFLFGVKILPDVVRAPSVGALRSDLELVNTLDADAVHVVIVPDAAKALVLDSIAHVLDPLRRADTTMVIVSLGYRGKLFPKPGGQSLDPEMRLRAVDQVMRRLRPDIILPAEDPYGAGAIALGSLPPEEWQDYITKAAAIVKRVRPRTRVGISASSFGSRDSTLYAWAIAPRSPVDVVGFSLFPGRLGAVELDASIRAADRWLVQLRSRKEHWVFATGAYPLAHGEQSQASALTGVLAWATSRPEIRGLVVTSSSDYGAATGLRAVNGRMRPAATVYTGAMRAIREASTDTTARSIPIGPPEGEPDSVIRAVPNRGQSPPNAARGRGTASRPPAPEPR